MNAKLREDVDVLIEEFDARTAVLEKEKNEYVCENKQLMLFLVSLKQLSKIDSLSAEEFNEVLFKWYSKHKQAVLDIWEDVDFDLLSLEADRLWPTIRKHSYVDQAMDMAKQSAFPPEAEQFPSPKLKLLVALCYQMQQISPEEPFFLSGRIVGEKLKCTQPTASRMLSGLVFKGIISVDQKGVRGKNASTYFYVGQETKSEKDKAEAMQEILKNEASK